MFFSGRSKQLPYLSEFLNRFHAEEQKKNRRYGLLGGIVGGVGGLMGAALGVLASLGVIGFSGFGLAGAIVGINLLAWLTVLGLWWNDRQRNRPTTIEGRIHAEAREAGLQMHQFLHRRRLHKVLDPVAGELLEEAARQWVRTHEALQTPFWTDPSLPAHWQAARTHALSSADQTMDEILVILRSSFRPQTKQGWHDVVEDVVETFFTGPKWKAPDGLPVGFQRARELADKLRSVAEEVERASSELTHEFQHSDYYSSDRALDMTLGELRSIRDAEDELRQNLQG